MSADSSTISSSSSSTPSKGTKRTSSEVTTNGDGDDPDSKLSRAPSSSSSSDKKHKAANYQPSIYNSVIPYVIVSGADAAVDFYKHVFKANEMYRMMDPLDPKSIVHSELKFGSSFLMLSEANEQWKSKSPKKLGGQSGCGLTVYVEDVDAVFARATEHAEVKVKKPLKDEFWGDRAATFTDPFGHLWTILTHIKDVDYASMPLPDKTSLCDGDDKKEDSAATTSSTSSSSSSSSSTAPTTKVAWKPAGYVDVIPYLYLTRGESGAQFEFYKRVFGGKEVVKMMQENRIAHAELKFGDTVVMCAECEEGQDYKTPAELGGCAVSLCYYVKDVDAFVEEVKKEEGIKIVHPITDHFYGARAVSLEDPWGYKWNVQTQIEDLTYEQIKERGDKLFKDMAKQPPQQDASSSSSAATDAASTA